MPTNIFLKDDSPLELVTWWRRVLWVEERRSSVECGVVMERS
jgi:hypothetical protein